MNESAINFGLLAQGGRGWVGGAEFTKNIFCATDSYCKRHGIPVKFTLFGDPKSFEDSTGVAANQSNVTWIEWPPKLTIGARIGHRLGIDAYVSTLQKLISKHRIDFLYPTNIAPQKLKCRSAAWIYDFQHKHMPHFFDASEAEMRDRAFAEIAKSSSAIVVSSQSALSDFKTFFPEAAHKARAIPFRVSIASPPTEELASELIKKYHLPKTFFIVCNQFWMHKNHELVVEATAQLRHALPEVCVVFTGCVRDPRDDSYIDRLLAKISQRNVYANIRILGLIPKRDQLGLIAASRAVIQPSRFEGWSTIVEESHSLGAPILVSDLEVHREQQAPYSQFFSPDDVAELTAKMSFEWNQAKPANTSAGYDLLVNEFGEKIYKLACGLDT